MLEQQEIDLFKGLFKIFDRLARKHSRCYQPCATHQEIGKEDNRELRAKKFERYILVDSSNRFIKRYFKIAFLNAIFKRYILANSKDHYYCGTQRALLKPLYNLLCRYSIDKKRYIHKCLESEENYTKLIELFFETFYDYLWFNIKKQEIKKLKKVNPLEYYYNKSNNLPTTLQPFKPFTKSQKEEQPQVQKTYNDAPIRRQKNLGFVMLDIPTYIYKRRRRKYGYSIDQ